MSEFIWEDFKAWVHQRGKAFTTEKLEEQYHELIRCQQHFNQRKAGSKPFEWKTFDSEGREMIYEIKEDDARLIKGLHFETYEKAYNYRNTDLAATVKLAMIRPNFRTGHPESQYENDTVGAISSDIADRNFSQMLTANDVNLYSDEYPIMKQMKEKTLKFSKDMIHVNKILCFGLGCIHTKAEYMHYQIAKTVQWALNYRASYAEDNWGYNGRHIPLFAQDHRICSRGQRFLNEQHNISFAGNVDPKNEEHIYNNVMELAVQEDTFVIALTSDFKMQDIVVECTGNGPAGMLVRLVDRSNMSSPFEPRSPAFKDYVKNRGNWKLDAAKLEDPDETRKAEMNDAFGLMQFLIKAKAESGPREIVPNSSSG